MGGPPAYSQRQDNQTRLGCACTRATGTWATWARRFVRCFEGALGDAGLPADPAFRAAMVAYMRWAVDDVLAYSPEDAVVPRGAAMPRWGWDGLQDR